MPYSESSTSQAIQFPTLLQCLLTDPYYGDDSAATLSIVNKLHWDIKDHNEYQQFLGRLTELGIDSPQVELVYIWCGFMELPAYKDEERIDWLAAFFSDNWAEDFGVQLDDLREFLCQHSWPLPSSLFPQQHGNTEDKVAADHAEFDRAWDSITTLLPGLEKREKTLLEKQEQAGSLKKAQKISLKLQKVQQEIKDVVEGRFELQGAQAEQPCMAEKEAQVRVTAWHMVARKLYNEHLQATGEKMNIHTLLKGLEKVAAGDQDIIHEVDTVSGELTVVGTKDPIKKATVQNFLSKLRNP